MELKNGDKVENFKATVVKASAPLKTKTGKERQILTLKYDGGEITMTNWLDKNPIFLMGSELLITAGYVDEYNDRPQLNLSKWGKIEVSGQSDMDYRVEALKSEKENIEEEVKQALAPVPETVEALFNRAIEIVQNGLKTHSIEMVDIAKAQLIGDVFKRFAW